MTRSKNFDLKCKHVHPGCSEAPVPIDFHIVVCSLFNSYAVFFQAANKFDGICVAGCVEFQHLETPCLVHLTSFSGFTGSPCKNRKKQSDMEKQRISEH